MRTFLLAQPRCVRPDGSASELLRPSTTRSLNLGINAIRWWFVIHRDGQLGSRDGL
jgi:hypothetical protein